MSDHRSAISLLSTALDACPDTTSELHAHLLNTKGCCFFELNDLEPCRAAWEVALSIRKSWSKKKAPGAEEELANQLSNFGNLESAVGHLDSALRYFAEAKDIRMRLGEGTIVPLGVTHMCTGRAYFLKQMYDKAEAEYDQARDIFIAKFGPNAHFMTQ
jgi:tetratricopeptide (TPR) repeat protein